MEVDRRSPEGIRSGIEVATFWVPAIQEDSSGQHTEVAGQPMGMATGVRRSRLRVMLQGGGKTRSGSRAAGAGDIWDTREP